jgi:hypothetical protein
MKTRNTTARTPPRPPKASSSYSSDLPPKTLKTTARTTPNKANPPTPEAVFSPSVASIASSIGSSSAGSRKTLTLFVQKQLLQDIEAAGGIKTLSGKQHKLSSICNQRPEIYGIRGEETRRRITKKVYRWQLLDRENQYVEEVLNRFQVKSFLVLKTERREKELKLASKKQAPLKKR